MTSERDNQRTITMQPYGEHGATSIKLSNLKSIEQIGAVISTVLVNTVAGSQVSVMSANLFLAALFVRDAVKEQISEQDASVFWGLIKLTEANVLTEEMAISRSTNAERRVAGWRELTEGEVKSSLHRLEDLNCIELLEGRWMIVEDYRIK